MVKWPAMWGLLWAHVIYMPLILKQLWPKPQPPWPNTKIEKIERIPLNGSVVCAQMSGCTLDHDTEPIIKIRGFKPSALPFCFHSFRCTMLPVPIRWKTGLPQSFLHKGRAVCIAWIQRQPGVARWVRGCVMQCGESQLCGALQETLLLILHCSSTAQPVTHIDCDDDVTP